jgi:hypothetical protein
MRQRRAEKGEHAVAQQLGDGALIGIDLLAHALVGAGNDLPPVLRIERFGQRRRTDDVGEERRHALALAFGPLAVGQDLAGHRRRGGAADRLEACTARHGIGGSRGALRLIVPAVTAELGGVRHGLSAIRAGPLERLAAVLAKP